MCPEKEPVITKNSMEKYDMYKKGGHYVGELIFYFCKQILCKKSNTILMVVKSSHSLRVFGMKPNNVNIIQSLQTVKNLSQKNIKSGIILLGKSPTSGCLHYWSYICLGGNYWISGDSQNTNTQLNNILNMEHEPVYLKTFEQIMQEIQHDNTWDCWVFLEKY